MPNEETYGFSRADAEQVVQSLDNGDRIIPGNSIPSVVQSPLIVKLPGAGINGRSDSSAATMPSGTCDVQSVNASTGVMSDISGVTVTGFNLSPNKLEGTDPRDGTSAMYAIAWPAGGVYVLSPLPWTTEAVNIQHDTTWDTDGLHKLRTLNMPLPVVTPESSATVATREPCE